MSIASLRHRAHLHRLDRTATTKVYRCNITPDIHLSSGGGTITMVSGIGGTHPGTGMVKR